MTRALWIATLCAASGCAASQELGLLQRAPGEGTGATLTGHLGLGQVNGHVLAGSVDVRGDLAQGGSRFALGASLLGGVPIGGGLLLGRAGAWTAVASSTTERTAVPTFELAGFIPLSDHPVNPARPEWGMSRGGLVIGVREDLDSVAYTTIFVGVALFAIPGY